MLFNMSEAEWDAVIAVHLKGAFNVSRAASVVMREQKGGRIISMSSVSALGAPGQPNYAAAKAGIIGLTWSTANALAKYGVTVNAIMPSGATRMVDSTPRGRAVFEQTGKWPSEQAAGTERDPDNVAPLVVYLASDAAANVNGQVFHSFGFGYTLLQQPQALRRLEADRRLDSEELAELIPQTRCADLKMPPSTHFGRNLGARPAAEWSGLGGGLRFCQWPREERCRSAPGEDRPVRLSRQYRPEHHRAGPARTDAGRTRPRPRHSHPLGRDRELRAGRHAAVA